MKRIALSLVLVAVTVAVAGLAQSPPRVEPRVETRAKAKKAKTAPAAFDETLPMLGTQLGELPAGPAKAVAESACLKCHSADILLQQRMGEKQWSANLTKMIGWGAEVPDDKKDELVAYLVKSFGPDNDRFVPKVVRPVGR